MPKDFYCGIRPDRLKRRMGSMQECLEADEVKYYGLKKIDEKMATNAIVTKNVKKSAQKIMNKIVGLKARAKTIRDNMPYIKDEEEQERLKVEYNKIKDLANINLDIYRELKKIEEGKKANQKTVDQLVAQSENSFKNLKKIKKKSKTNSKNKSKTNSKENKTNSKSKKVKNNK